MNQRIPESSWEAILFTIEELSTIPLFSTLGEKELEYLAGTVEDIHLIPGEYVGHEGEGRSLAIMVEGKAELTKLVNGVEQVIGVRLPGEVGGEIPMTLGTPLPASMRAVEPSRVLKLTVEVFHTLAAMAPQISEAVGAAALERIEMLKNANGHPHEPAMFVIGPRVDPGVHSCDSFLHRNQIPYERLDPDDPAAHAFIAGETTGYPVVVVRDGTRLINPTMRAVATVAGLTATPGRAHYDVVIVGGGPAGLTAAVNSASEGLQTALIESFAPGGQAGTSTRIENYTGFPYGVSGDELASRALRQAKRLGAEIVVTRRVEGIDPAELTVTLDGGDVLRTESIVLAMGVEWRRLDVDSIERFVGSGVYYGAARSDAGLAQGNDVYLIGAGNSAGQAAIFFSNHARSVTLLVRGESLAASMSHYLIEQIATKANVRVQTRSEVVAVHGDEQLEAIEVIDRETGTTSRRDARVLFVLIGAKATTDWLPPAIARDQHGFILTGTDALKAGQWKADREPFALETTAPGIFAVGDIRSGSVKRVAASVGEGGMAVAHVHRYLQLSR
ncbi:FAD-dependent oxidoreductase [Mycobacterium montefiorense]|uniref:Fused response regulator/thioredoxin-disulfide reductase n=1 Tax=Mycobacterium montefiorense TaxID=154654 RepID=A0AA37UZ71_9MYCO|nr:cyclic nucleotide-binding domain-containing thioredoxin-disulfide reductase [Mycobacterium montefiorense]GBG36584.1 fused response regulator/thioredoxin-disulfide reductase [Mycobacterium montefiorense]GKU36933.1 fused response regulator/thioredoxin-disulfide reductase [Mycobacterium montefiorense]GKU43161.1 fused response regulator/thioredoxin-disulfide reductase [Mycobacterium montefiorense]GKU48528.1 fused response regulator/thioredoxin-disulfide reductase [Mycobacterium montefiorense]GK